MSFIFIKKCSRYPIDKKKQKETKTNLFSTMGLGQKKKNGIIAACHFGT